MTVAGAARTERAVTNLIMGRRPVLDAGLAVVGYRLGLSGGRLTPDVVERVPDLAPVFGGAAAFVKPDRSYLTGEEQLPLPAEETVIEVGGELLGDRPAVEGLRALVGMGARVALHHTHGRACPDELLETAHFVFLHPGDAPEGLALRLAYEADLAATVGLCRAHGARVIAPDVHTGAAMREARGAGFDLFEGRLLTQPSAAAAQPMTPTRAACFQMLQKVNDPETSAAEIERIVETDPGLSYRILHVSGLGVEGGLRREVRSIREAAVLLGRGWIQKWLLMMVAADAGQGTPDQLTIAMVRARMCEQLASSVRPADSAAAFTVGLVSAMDLLLGWPLEEVVTKLAITRELKAALLVHDGPLGDLLADVVAWLDGDTGAAVGPLRCGAGAVDAESAYLEGLEFAAAVSAFLSGSTS